MRLRKIRLYNDPVLGNFDLDLTDNEGNTVNTVILAGENGSGKSYLLNVIFDLSLITIVNRSTGDQRKYEIELFGDEILLLKKNIDFKDHFANGLLNNRLVIFIDYRIKDNWNQVKITGESQNGTSLDIPGHLFENANNRKIIKTIFSDVEINFTPKEIRTVTSKNVDSDTTSSERSNNNIATEITQLLIDVQSIDALEFAEWARQNSGKIIDDEKLDPRIKRFTTAFNYMFPSKRYKRIQNSAEKKHVIFEENGKEMDIDKLSSGEKQIVFRGSFLLKNRESSRGALILLDEPEISLHPIWQLKILNFFKMLFTDAKGQQTSQIIVSTHSPFILHNSNRRDDKVIVLRKNDSGQTQILPEPKFLGWTSEKIVQDAFNTSTLFNDSKTKVFVEGETDEKYFNKALETFNLTANKITFKWIGRVNEKGGVENSGDSALNQAKVFFIANIQMLQGHGKVILLYDSDTNKPEEDLGQLQVRKMPKSAGNSVFKIGVENLLNIQGIDVSKFYKQRKKIDDYSAESTITELDKTALCDYICSLPPEILKKVLANLEIEIKRFTV